VRPLSAKGKDRHQAIREAADEAIKKIKGE
jgi:hypothetical protein